MRPIEVDIYKFIQQNDGCIQSDITNELMYKYSAKKVLDTIKENINVYWKYRKGASNSHFMSVIDLKEPKLSIEMLKDAIDNINDLNFGLAKEKLEYLLTLF